MSTNNGNGIYVKRIDLQRNGSLWYPILTILPDRSSYMLKEFLRRLHNTGYSANQLISGQIRIYNGNAYLIPHSNGGGTPQRLNLDAHETRNLTAVLREIGTDAVEIEVPNGSRMSFKAGAQKLLEEFIAEYI